MLSPEAFKKKVEKLSRYYDLSNPRDLFTVTMQEMEATELQVASRFKDKDGKDKKEQIMALIGRIAENQEVKEINLLKAVSAYVDDMCRASKLDYVINKEYK